MYNKAGVDDMEEYDKDQIIANYSKRVKKVREEKGFSKQWVADRAHITLEEYMQIEKGDPQTDNLSLIMYIAYILDISMDYLLGFSDEQLPSNQNSLLNKYDLNDPQQKTQREILHLITLLDDAERKEFLDIIKKSKTNGDI